jgi:hypothetical protein
MAAYEVCHDDLSPFTHTNVDISRHACGENPSKVYQDSRMDTVWSVRQTYDKTRQIKKTQEPSTTVPTGPYLMH